MLCKIPGNFELEKMKIIQVIETGINIYLWLVWGGYLVCNVINTNQFLSEKNGNKPGYQCSFTVLLKVTTFNLIYLPWATAAIFNNDVTTCYDRVMPFLSLLCCQRFGLPAKATDFIFHFLSTAKYHVRTCYSTSEEFNTTNTKAILGVLQGSGSGPESWLSMCLVLIYTYMNKFPTVGIPNPIGYLYFQKVINTFVKDADL